MMLCDRLLPASILPMDTWISDFLSLGFNAAANLIAWYISKEKLLAQLGESLLKYSGYHVCFVPVRFL